MIAIEIDRKFGHTVSLKQLSELINNRTRQKLDPLGFNGQSEYARRVKALTNVAVFRKVANHLKSSSEFAPNSNTYHEVFLSFLKKNKASGKFHMSKLAFEDLLKEKCAKFLNSELV